MQGAEWEAGRTGSNRIERDLLPGFQLVGVAKEGVWASPFFAVSYFVLLSLFAALLSVFQIALPQCKNHQKMRYNSAKNCI